MQTEEEHKEVTLLVQSSLGFFVNEYKPNNLSFPLLPNTYALWRRYTYSQVQKSSIFLKRESAVKFEFYLESQCHLLRQFIEKIVSQLHNNSSTVQNPLSEPSKIRDDIVQMYNKSLEMHSLYQQLLLDITTLPYLRHIFPQNIKYQLKQEFCPDIVGYKNEEQVGEKVSASIVNKGFGIIAQKIFSKTFIIQASSLAIRLNPVCMVASFAFGELISKYRKDKKGEQLEQKVMEALANTKAKAENLKNIYEECIGLLGSAIRLRGEAQKAFLSRIKQVLVEDWLCIEKSKDDDGWQIIELHTSKEKSLLSSLDQAMKQK